MSVASVFLTHCFTATGNGELGAVHLVSAHIRAQLNCAGAQLRNTDGPALHGNDLTVDGSVMLRRGFVADGESAEGAVRLQGVSIAGQLSLNDAALTNSLGPAVDCSDARIGQGLYAAQGFAARGAGSLCTVLLTGTRIDGPLLFAPALLENPVPSRRLAVDGLTYLGTPGNDWKSWLRLLLDATPHYSAQPYRQLASALQAAGHDDAVSCTSLERVAVGLNLGLPLIKAGDSSACSTSDTATGRTLTVLGWLLQALSWAFTTLFVAGFSGVIRRT